MKRDNPLVDGATLALLFGAVAFFPPLLDREFLITAWLGAMQQPVGLSAMVVGGALVAAGKLREFRNASPEDGPADGTAVGSHQVPDQALMAVGRGPGADAEGSREPSSPPSA